MHADAAVSDTQPARATAGGWPQIAAIGLIVVVLVLLAFDDGGYFPAAFTAGGALAFAGLGLLALVRTPRGPASRALVALASLAAFALWTGISGAWSLVPDAPLLDMQRAMLYLALFALGLLAGDDARRAGLLVWCVLGVVVVAVGAGVLSRLQPDVLAGPAPVPGNDDTRLSYPLGYWNAFGALATIGGVLATGLAADPRAARVLRALAAGAGVLLIVAMYLSLSRGAWLAFVAGIAVLLVLSRHRGTLLVSLGVIAAGAAAALLVLRSYPALVDGPRGAAQEAQGDAYSVRLAVIVVLAAAAQGVVAATAVPPRVRAAAARARLPALVLGCAVVVGVPLAGLLVRDGDGRHPTSAAAGDVSSFISRQWDDFLTPSGPLAEPGSARLLTLKGGRADSYRVALDGFAAQPLRGEGAGSYEVRFIRTRAIDEKLRDAHSLPLQTLAELGFIGFALLVCFLGAVLLALWRGVAGRGALRRSQAAAAGAAFVVWLVHSSIDWDWEMPAVTGAALVLGATLFAEGRRRSRPESPATGAAG